MYHILRKGIFSETVFRDFDDMNWKRHGYVALVCFLLLVFPIKQMFGCNPPDSDFNVDNTTPCVGQNITFTDRSDPNDAPITS